MTTFRSRRVRVPLAALSTLLVGLAACAGDDSAPAASADPAEGGDAAAWGPSKPVDYIAPAGSGGGWDTLARTTGRVLEQSDLVDVPFPVQNVEGGGGAIGWANIAGRAGDDHALFVTSPPIILVPLAGESSHDHTDFTPIARLITDYIALLVPADSPIESVDELWEAASSGDFSIAGGSAPGSMDHIALAGAADAAGIDATTLNYIPFSGGGEAMTAAMGGHVDAVVTGAGEALGQIESGTLRAIATTAPAGESPLEGVPSLEDEGIDYTFDIWRGVMGPADMPPDAVAFYSAMYADMLELDEWAAQRDGLGWIDAYQDSAEFGAFLDEQREEFSTILEDLGLRG